MPRKTETRLARALRAAHSAQHPQKSGIESEAPHLRKIAQWHMFGIPNRRIVLHRNSHHPLPWLHKALGPADGISSIAGVSSGRREAAIATANTKSPEQVLLQKQPGEPRPRKNGPRHARQAHVARPGPTPPQRVMKASRPFPPTGHRGRSETHEERGLPSPNTASAPEPPRSRIPPKRASDKSTLPLSTAEVLQLYLFLCTS
jgi:hypothetical protein